MESTPQLYSVLQDTQESLAAALARIQTLRIREKYLAFCNSRLRAQIRENGLVPDAPDPPPNLTRRRSSSPQTPRSGKEDAQLLGKLSDHLSAGDRHCLGAYLYEEAQEHPIILLADEEQVPASLITTPSWIEIVEHKVHISAGQIVGMSAVDNGVKGRILPMGRKSTNSSWLGYLFRKSKDRDSVAASRHSSAPATLAEPGRSEIRPGGPSNGTTSFGGDEAKMEADGDSPSGCLSSGVCQVLWKDGGGNGQLKRVVFEASVATQAHVHKHVETWSHAASSRAPMFDDGEHLGMQEQGASSSKGEGKPSITGTAPYDSPQDKQVLGEDGELVPPQHLIPIGQLPELNVPSKLLTDDHLKGIMAAVPKRLMQANWSLLYSTAQHGFSLQSLYRKAAGCEPTVLVVKDPAEYIFGSFCSEAWKIAPRFYGTGESFVFQLEPHRVYYSWKRDHKSRNDFFMFGSQDSIGVGGTGHFAIWIDGELLYGHSGVCDTFGSPCLASKEEFKIIALELWVLS